ELPLLGAAGGLPKCIAYAAVVLVPVGHSGYRSAALEGALDELVEAVAVALLAGRALRLAVVGADDELVRPRRVGPGALDAGELLVELAQRLERVCPLEAGVVRDLVGARDGCGERGATRHHVG